MHTLLDKQSKNNYCSYNIIHYNRISTNLYSKEHLNYIGFIGDMART